MRIEINWLSEKDTQLKLISRPGPFAPSVEELIVNKVYELIGKARASASR